MSKPKGDLGALMISKGIAAAARPFQTVAPLDEMSPSSASPLAKPVAVRKSVERSISSLVQTSAPSATRAMTLKIPEDVYWQLHEFCAARGRARGRRVTHQEIMLESLLSMLTSEQP